jgi:hypothetical protein
MVIRNYIHSYATLRTVGMFSDSDGCVNSVGFVMVFEIHANDR